MESNKFESEIIRLGLILKKLRLKEKFTQEHLSALCEVDVRTIQRIEKGKQNITISLLFSLADALNIKPSNLLNILFEEEK